MTTYKLIGNTSWGYCFTPRIYDSKSKAQSYGRQMKRDGYWFDYRIIEVKSHE